MFWRVTGESQLINSFKMAIWKVHHNGRLMANFFSLQVEMLKYRKNYSNFTDDIKFIFNLIFYM